MKIDPALFAPLLESVSDPAVKGVAQLLLSQLGGAGDDERALARRRRAERRLRRLHRLLELQAQRNAFVAAALGACPCWGDDASCPDCHGRGSPGFIPPDPTAFDAVVVPLLRARPAVFAQHLAVPDPGGAREACPITSSNKDESNG